MITSHGSSSNQGTEPIGTPDSRSSEFEEDEEEREEEDGEEDEEEEAESFYVRALYDFTSNDSSSLSFERGAVIEVLTQLESGWWDGLLSNDVRGWFPSNYVEMIPKEEAEMEMANLEGDSRSTSTGDTMQDSEQAGSSQYGGLGIGSDIDVLRQLMNGDSAMESNDVFEQLAEAGMRDSSQDLRSSGQSKAGAERLQQQQQQQQQRQR
jgi:son of sevenless-like protein